MVDEDIGLVNLAIGERLAFALSYGIITTAEAVDITKQKSPEEMVKKFSDILKIKEDERRG